MKTALVTGANRGIGLEVSRRLAAAGLHVVMGCRDVAAGERAAAGIEGSTEVVPLDVTDQAGVDALAARLGVVHVLVNNAGIMPDDDRRVVGADLAVARRIHEVNVLGPWRMCSAIAPLMREGGRIVNLSSRMGQLSDMQAGSPGYRVSKAALNALTVTLARELRGRGILVNAACPGWVQTDMGGASAPEPVEQGADTPVWLALLPDDGPTGGFFHQRAQLPW